MAKRTYMLGWVFLILALAERAMMGMENVTAMANRHNLYPHNLLQLSAMFFLIAVASHACCSTSAAKVS